MTGVEIINQYSVYTPNDESFVIGFFITLAPVLSGLIITIVNGDGSYLVIGALMGSICGMICGFGCSAVMGNEQTRYEVSIDDTVLMSEFYKKYNVIEQEGNIFVVEEKNNNVQLY